MTVKDEKVKKETHRYVMKVYKIRIVSFQRGGIWYTTKVGHDFYAVLTTKLNKAPAFRVIEINEDRTYLASTSIILEVYPVDCNVIDEFVIKSNQSMKHLCM